MSKTQKKPTTKSKPIIKVVWKDHYSCQLKSGWSGDLDLSPVLVTSVGVVVAKDKEVLCLAQNWDGDTTHGNTISILKNCIVSKKIIK